MSRQHILNNVGVIQDLIDLYGLVRGNWKMKVFEDKVTRAAIGRRGGGNRGFRFDEQGS